MNDLVPRRPEPSVRTSTSRGASRPLRPGSGTGNLPYVIPVFRRQWWVILLCLMGGLLLAMLYLRRATPKYQAVSTLRLSEGRPVVPGFEALEQMTRTSSEVSTEQAVLASRTLAQAVVDSLALRVRLVAPVRAERQVLFSGVAVEPAAKNGTYRLRQVGDSLWELIGQDSAQARGRVGEAIRVSGLTLVPAPAARTEEQIDVEVVPTHKAVDDLTNDLTVGRPSRDVSILRVRYVHHDPGLAHQVPNVLVASYIARRASGQKVGARSTVAFLRAQLDTMQKELQSAEDSLRVFKELNQSVAMDEQTRVSVGRLADLQAQRGQVAAELAALEATMDSARGEAGTSANPAAAYRRLLAFPTLLRTAAIPGLLQTLTTLETERATLAARRQDTDRDVVALSRRIEAVEEQVEGIVRTYTTGLREQVAAFDHTLAQSGAALRAIPAREVRLAQLMRNTIVLGELSSVLQTRLKEAEIAEAVDDASAEVVDVAERPVKPASPRALPNLALGALLGLLLGGLLVYFREGALRLTLQDREVLQEESRGFPVLGVVPRIVGVPGALARVAPQSPAMEAYRALRTSIAHLGESTGPQVVLVTSPVSGDGKSTSAVNLAAAFAQQGLRTLVLDADLRRGALHSLLGVPLGRGLGDLLAERSTLSDAMQHVEGFGGHALAFVSRGGPVDAPAELLASSQLDALLGGLRLHFDRILIDSPPVNAVSDALILARVVDGVMVVTRGGQTRRGALRFALDQLASVRAPVVGTILNAYDPRRAGEYDDYDRSYGEGYASSHS